MKQRKDWQSVIKRYGERDGTSVEFARREGVKLSTLQYHLVKVSKTKRNFHPIAVEHANLSPQTLAPALTEPTATATATEMRIEFTSGVKIFIRG
jgi:hypothetical protein